jgi:CCR4-NOT transcriptional regulation complex NOT5 subunit
VLSDREIYNRFDVDQLFFIFYYYSGSYEQSVLLALAAAMAEAELISSDASQLKS